MEFGKHGGAFGHGVAEFGGKVEVEKSGAGMRLEEGFGQIARFMEGEEKTPEATIGGAIEVGKELWNLG
jgi:hypothetical protein